MTGRASVTEKKMLEWKWNKGIDILWNIAILQTYLYISQILEEKKQHTTVDKTGVPGENHHRM